MQRMEKRKEKKSKENTKNEKDRGEWAPSFPQPTSPLSLSAVQPTSPLFLSIQPVPMLYRSSPLTSLSLSQHTRASRPQQR